MSLTITPDVGTGNIDLEVNGIFSLNDCVGAASIISNTLAVSTDIHSNQITIDLSGGAVATSLNGLSGDVMIVSNTLAISTDLSNQITIDFSGGAGVTSLDGLSGDVIFTNSDGSIVGTVSGQTIDFVVAVPVPAGTYAGDYPAWDGSGAYTLNTAPVASLSAPSGDPNLSGPINLTTNGSLTILGTYTSPNTIAFDVAVPVPAGTFAGDYPAWDAGIGAYALNTAPVASLSAPSGDTTLTGPINLTTNGSMVIVGTESSPNTISVDVAVPVLAGTNTGDYPAWDAGTSAYVAQAPLPSGLAVPAAGDVGSATFTISGVSVLLSPTSVVQATMQVVDNTLSAGTCWLEYATPRSANGGSIIFYLSDPISEASTMQIAWAVIKY
jgi:hypothetical protein